MLIRILYVATINVHSPIAVLLLSVISTETSVGNGILRTSVSCTSPSFSLTEYIDWLKDINIGTSIRKCTRITMQTKSIVIRT